jgi:hypothetical protein
MGFRNLARFVAAAAIVVGAAARAEEVSRDGATAVPRAAVATDPAAFMAGQHGRILVGEFGFVSGSGPTGWMNGVSIETTWRSKRVAAGFRVQRLWAPTTDRLQGFGELGLVRPIGNRWNAVALALGGVDLLYTADHWAAPAAGVRVGVEWSPPSPFASYGLSLTTLGDLTTVRGEGDRVVTGFSAVLALSVSIVFSHAKPR